MLVKYMITNPDAIPQITEIVERDPDSPLIN